MIPITNAIVRLVIGPISKVISVLGNIMSRPIRTHQQVPKVHEEGVIMTCGTSKIFIASEGGAVLPATSAFAVIGRPPVGSSVKPNKGPMYLILPIAGHKGLDAVPLGPLKNNDTPMVA